MLTVQQMSLERRDSKKITLYRIDICAHMLLRRNHLLTSLWAKEDSCTLLEGFAVINREDLIQVLASVFFSNNMLLTTSINVTK